MFRVNVGKTGLIGSLDGKAPRIRRKSLVCCLLAAMHISSVHAVTEKQEYFYIDPQVQDFQQLLDTLPSEASVLVLDPERNGFAQIADHLTGRSGINAIHLISHGKEGEIQAGNIWLSAGTILDNQDSLARIGTALSESGDFLIYGCKVAVGSVGTSLIDQIAKLTGADIAASNDWTGDSSKGGNWVLESSTGAIESDSLLAAASYEHVLNTLNAGDIVMLGWSAITDTITFATLVDIPSGTVIKITDWGWNAAGTAFIGSTTADGLVTWTTSSTISAGTLFNLFLGGTGDAQTTTLTNVTTSANLTADIALTGYSTTDPMGVSGDGIFIYQDSDANPYFIFGLNNSAGVNIDANNWNTATTFAAVRDSTLPGGTGSQNALTSGTNAIGLPGGGSQNDNVQYTGATTAADRATWLARITNSSNWTGDSDGTATTSVGTSGGSAVNVNIAAPTPTIINATYNSSTGALVVTGTNFAATGGATNDVVANKFTLTAEGGSTYTLTDTANVEITSATSFTLTLSATDRAAVNLNLNKNGTSSTGGTTYNLAGAAGFIAASAATADTTGNGITVSNVAVPAITSATYDANSGALVVTGTNMKSLSGATNDIVANKFTLTGEGGSTWTLTDTSNVEITSGTSFTLTLSATDRASINLMLNKNGTSSTGGTTFNLAAAEDWAVGADAAVVVVDATGNGVTVSNVAVPAITSAAYNANTGALIVTGTNLKSSSGATNDIVANKFTLTGEGGSTWTLTDTSNVEITSGTSFTLTLSATDRASLNLILNKNGTSSTGATTYNLAAAEDWAAGADAAVVVVDATGNGVTVSNVAVPAITSATYDANAGALVVTGTNLKSASGATNDIVANKFTLTGEGGSTWTLTDTANVEITSGTSFTLMLSATDKAGINLILNKNGNSSTGGTTYNLATAEDWAAGADAAVTVADLTGNGIAASNVIATTSLATSPTLIFTTDLADDDVATDGEGGSIAITDIDIQIFNISDVDGTPADLLFWRNNGYLSSSDSAYSALTYDDGANSGTKGMAIKSADGSEFQLEQFSYYNWGETESATISVAGYRNGAQVALTTFEGFDENSDPMVVTFDASFANVDDVRLFISAGGYLGDQTATHHSINNIQLAEAEADSQPPVFQNSMPSIGDTNTAWTTLSVRLDENGTAYYVVFADGAGAPNSEQVIAGQNSSSTAALASGSFNIASAGADYSTRISGLLAGTAYDIYVVTQDDEITPNVQSGPTLVNLTTSTANALYFDTDAKVTGLTGISPAAFTVEFNLYLDSETPAGNWQGIYWTNNNNDTGIFIEDNYAVSLWTTQTTAYKSSLLLTYGAWNHVAISYSAGNGVRMYINGALSGVTQTGNPGAGVLPLTDVTVGYGPGNFGLPAGGYALGDSALDDFRIWNVERTQQQINDDKEAELSPPYSANLVRYYDFNHGIGGANNAGITTLIERTGNGANGTLANFALDGDVSNWVETSSLASAPTVTDGNISISGASGVGGAYRIGDTVTATWNNTAGGNNNLGITGVTADFSQFGGGAAVVATENTGTWTATYTITAGAIDSANRNVIFTATNATGSTTVADTTNAAIDNVAPLVSDGAISISGASGVGGAYKVGDTVTATWINTAGGDNNSDTISSATVNFSQFGGDPAVVASNGSGTWTATYTITAGALDTANRNVSVTATDNAGNTVTTVDTTNATVDNAAPTVTNANISISGASGTGGGFIAGDTVTATWSNTAGGDNNSDTISSVTVDFSAFGGGAGVTASNSSGTWTATFGLAAGTLESSNLNVAVTAADDAGNTTTTADTSNATVDTLVPAVSSISVPANATYIAGQNLDFTVNISQAVTVDTSGGTPRLALTVGSSTVYAAYISGSASSALTFRYTVQAGDLDANGISLNALEANSGTLRDASGNNLTLTLNSVGNTAAVLVDAVVPTVISVSVPSSATYVSGEVLGFTVNASEAVTVDTAGGIPSLALVIGGVTRNATFTSGGGTSALVFSYTVQAGDLDNDGISVGALDANGGTLKDAAGNNLTLTLNAVGSTTGVLVDAVAPTLLSLNPLDDAMAVAPNANLVVTFSEDIALGTGAIAVYDSNDVLFTSIDVTNHGNQLSITDAALTIDLTTSLLEDVSYYVQIASGALTDLAGNAYAGIADDSSWSFSVADITPPSVVSVTVSGSPTASAAAIQFTVTFDEVPATVTVADFALTPSSASVSGSIASVSPVNANTVTVTIDEISGTGTLRLDVIADSGITDALGNGDGTNGYVAAFTGGDLHTVDRDVPVAPGAPNLAAASDSGQSDTDDITNVTTPTLTGTAEANATVTFSSSVDGSLGTTTADGSGNWSFTPGTPLTEGTHFISTTATDTAGNVSVASASLTLQLDTSAPTGHSVGFGAGFYNAGNLTSASFTFAGAEVGADYSYTISSSGGTPVTGSGTLASATDAVTGVNLSGLSDGALTLSAIVTDTAGNAAPAVTANAVKDTVLPTGHSVSFNDTTLNATEAGSTGFTFAGAEVGAAYNYSITSSGGGTAVTGNGTFATATDAVTGVNLSGLADGELTLSVEVADTSGNAASAISANASLDQAVPSVTLTSVAAATVNDAFDVTITFSEAVSNFIVGDITTTNASLSGFVDNGGGNYGVTVTPTADGAVTLDVAAAVAQDAAGNNNTAATSLSRIYDGTAPTLASSNPADGANTVAGDANLVLAFSEPVLAGSGNLILFDAADDSVVEIFAISSVTINSTVVTLDPTSDLVPTHSYYLQIANTALVDAAGNAYAGINDATTLNFTVSNTAPVANADIGSVAEDTAVSISVLANDTDADSGLNPASVIVVTAPQQGTTSVNTGTGVITYTPTANYHGVDSFTYTVEDVFSSLSNTATVTVTVSPVNDAPVAVGDLAFTPEDNAVSIDVAVNDTDIDTGDGVVPASIVIVSAPANGTAVVVDGEVLYTPNLDFNGSDGFTYTIGDQDSAISNVASVVINVTGVNDLPTAGADTATVDEDSEVSIEVLTNDSDLDGSIDATSVSILATASHGSTSVDALTGVITYTPAAHYNGTDTFSYTVQDNSGGSATATVTVTVTSINDAPVANADSATLQEDVAHTINVLGNDTDLDGTLVPASVQVVTAAGQGTTSVNATTGAIVYTPGENFNGSDSFTYRVQDNQGTWSAPASVTLTVEDLNDEPLANPDSVATSEDTAVTVDLLVNDSDVDGTLDPAALILVTQPVNGSLTDNGDGTVRYSPVANFFGTDSFTYTVADEDGGVSNTATVTVTVNPVNDAPVISGTPTTTVAEDSAYSFVPTASDVDNTTLTFSIANLPEWASFNTTTGALTGTPENDHVGNHSGIVITVSDGSLTAALPAFAISVSNVNDPPVISGTPPATINQGGSYNFTPTVVDVDPGTTLTYSITNQPSWASFDPATGAFTGTPANSDVGIYNNIVISVSDGVTTTPLTSFNVVVANVNDAPVIAGESYNLNEGSALNADVTNGVLANDVDIDGDTLTATLVTAPRNASQFILNGDGSFSYLHRGDETRVDTFTYRISDGTVTSEPVTVNLNIAAVNDAPTFVTSPEIATLEGAVYTYDVGVTDPDSAFSLALIEPPEWLTLTGNRLTGTAPLNEIGAVSVVLRAQDSQYTVDQTYNLTVVEQETSLVSITTSWLGLPSIVGSTVDLLVTLTHNKGPALSGASLAVNLRDVDTAATMANCTAGTNAFTCPVSLAAGASTSFRLRVTPAEEGNLIVNLNLSQATETVAATITDVSVTKRAVSQGDVTFNIANATALASINLLNDGTRELVAGTSLGDTVKLLNYTISSGTAQVIGEIDNRGYTDRVRVADIDQDGLEDIVVVNRSGAASGVYYDRGDSFAAESGSVPLAHAREALVRDLNDDGYPELILGASGFNLYIYENNEGVYDIPPLVFNSPASIVHFALLRRLPTDAPLEGTLVITSANAVQLVRFGLSPDGGVSKPEDETDPTSNSEKFTLVRSLDLTGVSSVQLVDIDGDGREEIVASTTHQSNSSEASGVTIIAVTTDDQLQTVARLGAASAKHVEVADFNGDGIPDLLVANANNSYQFYRGTGTLTSWTLTNTILYHSSTLVIPEDVNGDGLADVLIYEDGEEQVELYLSAPDGDTGETADLVVAASVTPVQPNTYQFEYTLNLANQGAFIAENVRVNLPLPAGVGIVTLPDNCTHDEEVDEVNCSLPNLEAAAEQAIVLVLEGDGRTNGLSLTAHATSDALEVETANNSTTTSLSGMFQFKRARIKGGGGCFDYLWLAGLLGLELRRRRTPVSTSVARLVPPPGRGRLGGSRMGRGVNPGRGSNPSPTLPLLKGGRSLLLLAATLVLAQPSQQAQAETPTAAPAKNSYIEGSFGSVTSDWDTLHFYYDLMGATQEGALRQKDDQRLGWQLLYGFRAHRNLALEVGFIDSGETELEVDAIASDTGALRQLLIDNAPVSGDGPYVGLRASFFAHEDHELYLKAGLWSWSAGYDLAIDDQHEWVTKDGTDWLFGMGFAVPVNQHFKVGAALQSTSLGSERLMMVGINLAYRFDVGRGR